MKSSLKLLVFLLFLFVYSGARAQTNSTQNFAFVGPRPWIDVSAYGAIGDGGAERATGAISARTNFLAVSSVTGTFKIGMYIHVNGAGTSGDTLLAKITAINGSTYTLDRNAGTTVAAASVQEDDTLPIQAAMAAFCAQTGAATGGSIYFPPGNYIFSQPQTSNPNAIPFQPGCQGMHFLGSEEKNEAGSQFYSAPQSALLANCGSTYNAQAAFDLEYPYGQGVTFENLVIAGCNQGMRIATNFVHLKNTSITGGGTGTDASALHLSDMFWFFMDGGSLQSSTTAPALLMTADAGRGTILIGNIYISNAILVAGNISFIQRANINGGISGHWVFRNITQESGNGDLLTITNPGAFTIGQIGPIMLDDVQQADNAATSQALISFNPNTNATLTGVTINNSATGSNYWPAIKVLSGTVDNVTIKGCRVGCTNMIVNGSGLPIGPALVNNQGGLDSIVDTSSTKRLANAPLGNNNIDGAGGGMRLTPSGSPFASLGFDPVNGVMFGSPTLPAYNAQIFQGILGNVDIAFAANYPPTNVSAMVSNSGGSLGAGTSWYVYVVSTTGADCNDSSKFSAPSAITGPMTITGSTGSIALTWTPAATGLIPVTGYCVLVDGNGQYNYSDFISDRISGASSAGGTVTSFPHQPGAGLAAQMVAVDHLTPKSATFNNVSLPPSNAAPPYVPSCLATVTCSGFVGESPFAADTFMRANAASLGANWMQSYSGRMIISGNAATVDASGSYATDYFSAQQFLADQFSRATVHAYADTATDLVQVNVRMASAPQTFYSFSCINGTKRIDKYVAGANKTLATTASACSVNDAIELDAVGSITVYLTAIVNGAVALTATDSSSPLGTGGVGIGIWNSKDSLVNWVGGSLPIGNGGKSILNQPNTWAAPQNFAVATLAGISLGRTVASGTATLGTSEIASGACAAVVTVSAPGVATTDVINAGFNGDPTSTTGYLPSKNGPLSIIAYPSANDVNFKVCNNTSASITPGVVALNWIVNR